MPRIRWAKRCNHCGRWAIRGTVVCKTHGGTGFPRVRAAAKRRLAEIALTNMAASLARGGTHGELHWSRKYLENPH